MCRVPVQLRELVKQRLAAAAEEIFELLEKTITEYEEHLVSKYEQQRRQGALYTPDGGFSLESAEGLCEPPNIKEEQDAMSPQLCSLKTDEQLSPPTWNTSLNPPPAQTGMSAVPESEEESTVSVKTEEEEAWTPPLHHAQPVPLPPAGGALLKHTQTVPLPPVGGALLQHTQTVPLPPAGGALLQHTQTVPLAPTGGAPLQQTEEEPQDAWTEEQLDLNRTLDCGSPLSPAGGAVLHQDLVGKVRKRRGGGGGGGGSGSGSGGISQKRPHECPLCGLRFQSHFNLETHLRVHTGERPFSCPVCEKTFNRKDSMANHMKIHLGETFCCSECGKRYSDKSNLRRHTLSMHGGKGHLTRPVPESQDTARKQVT